MTNLAALDAYGTLVEPATLKMERLLPGPIERIWAYLTESDLRRQWFAGGEMELEAGTPVEFVWRNDTLTDPPGVRPDGMSGEHRMESRITEIDPPRKLAFTFGTFGVVTFTLDPKDKDVLLTLIHARVPDRSVLLRVSTGWHLHLDVLAARAAGRKPEPFWDNWTRYSDQYEKRLPA